MMKHYRKDSAKGITAPNPDANADVIQHITKHRGMKSPFTSMSEDMNSIHHFSGTLYEADPNSITADGHIFWSHHDVISHLSTFRNTAVRKDKLLVDRAIMLAKEAREALVQWSFDFASIERKNRITFCYNHIQKYFSKV